MQRTFAEWFGLRRLAGGLAGMAAVVFPAVASAQEQLSEAARETSIPGGQLVIVSYIVLWVALLAYVGYLARQQQSLDREIDELEERIEDSLE